MIDWVTILIALVIIAGLVTGFGFVAWKINMSDPLTADNLTGKKDETSQLFDSVSDKKRKDKNTNEQKKKKRNVQKKSKRDSKDDEESQHVTFKEPSTQTSEETDNEREESEQESSSTAATLMPTVAGASSKARKRKNKARAGTPPPSSGPVEGILHNKDEKSPVTSRAPPLAHPKLVSGVPKDEVELAKQHHQQGKAQVKPSHASNKQNVLGPVTAVKKTAPPSSATNANQNAPKQQQQQQQEQPFTTVVGKGHKGPAQQQQQQQTKSTAASSTPAPPVLAPIAQQQAPVQVQQEPLVQRQPVRQQKETSAQANGYNSNSLPAKQLPAPQPPKIADLVKALPTSQVVVTELMSALDAFPLTTDELNIIMQKIANKQSLIKQDWSKLQHGQRVDPQAHIGQVLDESARAYEEDLKTNAMKRIKELTEEAHNDKRRINDLLKEANEKDINIQALRSQLNSLQHQHQHQHPQQQQQQQFQTYEAEYRRLADENMQLKQRLAQQQQHFQQQQHLSSLNLINNNSSDPTNVQARVVSDQIKKLSIDNGKLEKQLASKDVAIQELQKERDVLIHSNQQLSQKVQESQKQFQHNEKILKEFNENRTLHVNQLNEYKRRIEELESKNEQLRQAELARAESINQSTLNNEERQKFEQDINQLAQENEQYKKKFDDIQSQYQSKENELRQEIDQLKNKAQQEESLAKELVEKNTQLESLRNDLEEIKSRNDTTNSQLDERVREEHEKHKQFLVNLLEPEVRNQLSNDNQDFNQWLSSYQQLFASSNETSKRALQAECDKLKHENDQLHKNMSDVETQLKDIEQTVQSKEEVLLADLKNKDAILENIQQENAQLSSEIQRLHGEIDRLYSVHQTVLQESQDLKRQLNERPLLHDNHSSSSNATLEINGDEATALSSPSNQEQTPSES